jgi:hypothetical protein
MSIKRSVILKGSPIINEDGIASAEVRPGYLVKGVSTIAHQTATTGFFANAVALERNEIGAGIDNSLQSSGTGSAYYASGDKVKVAVFAAGMEATMFVPTGQNIVEDDLLESNGAGLLIEGSVRPIARAKETLGVTAATVPLRVEFL